MLILSLLDTGKSPVENFLKGVIQVQNIKGTVLSTVQLCIMYDLLEAEKLFKAGKMKSAEVPLQHIQNKYDLERWTASRNAVMLSDAELKDRHSKIKNAKGEPVRKGRGWVTSVDYVDPVKKDSRQKALKLTKEGRACAELMFRQDKKLRGEEV